MDLLTGLIKKLPHRHCWFVARELVPVVSTRPRDLSVSEIQVTKHLRLRSADQDVIHVQTKMRVAEAEDGAAWPQIQDDGPAIAVRILPEFPVAPTETNYLLNANATESLSSRLIFESIKLSRPAIANPAPFLE